MPALLGQSYRNAILNLNGIAGYWRLGDTAGAAFSDAASVNDIPTSASPAPTVGVVSREPRNATLFVSASLTYGQKSPPAGLASGAASRTYLMWLKTSTAADMVLFQLGDLVGAADAIWIGMSPGGGIYLGQTGEFYTIGSGYNNGAWRFLSVVIVGPRTYSVYVDGALAVTDSFGADMATNSGNLYIGRRSDGLYYDGSLAEVAVIRRDLAQQEIANLYRLGRGF